MKKNNLFCIVSILFLILTGCKSEINSSPTIEKEYVELTPDKYNAVELNNQVTSIQKAALVTVDSIFRADTATIYQSIDEAIFELDVSINRLNSLGKEHEVAFYFTESVSNLLKFYKTEFETDFKALIPILKKKKLSKEDELKLNVYDQEFVDYEADLFNEILFRQDSFAKFFSIGLVD